MPVPVKRYAPFVAVVLAQCVLVALAPSRAPVVQAADAPLPFDTGIAAPLAGGAATDPGAGLPATGGSGTSGPAQGAAPVGGGAGGGTAGTPSGAGGATGGSTSTGTPGGTGSAGTGGGSGATGPPPGSTGGSATGSGSAPATGSGASGGAAGGASGSTVHCVGGRQFGPGFSSAPRCVPTHSGSNGGATTRGVTAAEIRLLYYRPKENEVVNGFTRSQNLYGSPEEQSDFLAKAQKFINSKWELYGRELKITFVRGTCDYSPPADDCLRTEARALVREHQPFAFIWENNSAVPSMADELSRLKVVNFMGWHFDDSFSVQRRPYHYDQYMGGTTQARITGEWWCKRMAGKKARYAGDAVIRTQVRKAAISHPDAEVNKGPSAELARILRGCGTVVVDAPYSSNTATAASQASTSVARLKAEGVTSVLFFSDPISPAFSSKAATSQNWFPENVLVGSGLVDYDVLGRLYDPEQWKNAFGLSDLRDYEPFPKQSAVIAYKGGGGTRIPYAGAQLPWAYLNTVANGIQMAGADLNPLTFERALLSGSADYGGDGNPFQYWNHFAPGDYSGISDVREVYWDARATSRIDGRAGAYVSLNGGRRYKPGDVPRSEFTLPGRR